VREMSESVSLLSIPGLTSTNPEGVINGIITATLKGVKVYLTASALAKLKPYFDKLGVKVREATVNLESENYILLSLEGARIKVEIHDNGKVHSRSFRTDVFISALERYIEKRKGANEGVKLYELLISEDLKEKLMKLKGETK
jgi:hypothetical protein